MSEIPKILHYAWFGGKVKPQYLIDNIKSWKKYMPEYEIHEWNENNWDINKNAFSHYFSEKKLWGFVSDVLRVDVLKEFGGIYLDTDVELKQSLKPFEELPLFLSMHFSNAIGTSLIGAEKNNETITELADYYDSLTYTQIIKEDFDPVNNGIFTRFFIKKYNTFKFINRKQIFDDGTVIFPNYVFVIPAFFSKHNFAIHQLRATWQSKKENGEQSLTFKGYLKNKLNKFHFGEVILIRYSFWVQSRNNSIAYEFGKKKSFRKNRS
ncbi:glycosyltransferase family 32 protein [Weissella paramesenteroides]|uniref:glycosyltransferase family 32 protein n=1 Tax=Weissella paramesenteroides TaxID=1249 RepID=UPI0020739715|nr:glycosyltransferase [Weissella paramesenteroides]MCM6765391.1 mannosyltransferase [Weissella paramesenteroides]MCM6766762.1 mannosyltransferase [Weissella paramesenteroides]MCM6771474.1 mannosyltransferase [Weissella paramesenteroides]MCM6779433.1 mannosyltransferase [Weissella paramesenteroides]MCM6782026.1 mannosyltransferase [Weissella paramesenteroides]